MQAVRSSSLIELPVDIFSIIVEKVLEGSPSLDAAVILARLAQTCRVFKNVIYNKNELSKALFRPDPSTPLSLTCGFIRSPLSPHFVHYDLRHYKTNDLVLQALIESPVRERLVTLTLTGAALSKEKVLSLLQTGPLPSLKRLELAHADLSPSILEAIPLQCPALSQLTIIECSGLDDGALTKVVSQLALKLLVIRGAAALPSAGFLTAMGQSPICQTLEHFELERCLQCSAPLFELAKKGVSFAGVKALSLSGSPTEPGLYQMLGKLFPSSSFLSRTIGRIR